MVKTKKKIEIFDLYDVQGMQKRLEAMARQGWFIESMDKDIWTYRKGRPHNTHYAVTHFANYSNSEAEPDRGQAEFLEMCSASGWEYVTHYNSLFVFINNSDTPVPLETDAVTQVDNIDRTVKSASVQDNLHTALIMLIFPLVRKISDIINDPSKFIDDPAGLFMFFVFFAYIVMFIIDRFNYKQWYTKAEAAAAETGVLLPVEKNRQPQAMIVEVIIVLLIPILFTGDYSPLFLTGIYISLVLASGIYFYCKRINKLFKVLAGFAVIVVSTTIMIFVLKTAGLTPVEIRYSGRENMAVSMEKLGIQPSIHENVSTHTEFRCFLFERYEGKQQFYADYSDIVYIDFQYTLIKTKSEGFYNNLKKDYMHRMGSNTNEDVNLWQSLSAHNNEFKVYNGQYKYDVYYNDAILRISSPTALSDSQITYIVDNLIKVYNVEVAL